MTCCSHCQEAGELFDIQTARKQLKQYRKKGAWKATRFLLDEIRKRGVDDKSLLDIGGGVGLIGQELFKDKLNSATLVEASEPYLKVAEEAMREQGYQDRFSGHSGDFVAMADELPKADIVTLDRVICCYPYMQEMVKTATAKANKLCGVVYPRVNVVNKVIIHLGNLAQRIRQKDFCIYLHERADVDDTFHQESFQLVASNRTFVWHIDLYERS